MPDPRGDNLRAKIAGVVWEEGEVEWLPLDGTEPEFVRDILPYIKNLLGTDVVKVTTVVPYPNQSSVLLTYWDNDKAKFTKYVLINHPEAQT